MRVPIHAPGVRNGETGGEWKGMLPPPGKHWQYKPSTLDELDKAGHIHWSANGNPRKKVYLDEHSGVSVQDIWMDFKDAHNQNIKITGYPTEKNPDLLERIINASSNPDSLILDCFAGSGTTLDVASKLGRKWIGVDRSFESIATICHRLAHGTSKMGDFRSSPKARNVELQLFDESIKFDLSIDEKIFEELLEFSKKDSRKELFNLASLIKENKTPKNMEPTWSTQVDLVNV
jgi:adenine-specific DNA-methyltransferase